jgi:NADPH:quinone reductase-like Zn-dependent oxidoreductase
MRVVEIRAGFGLDALTVTEQPDPEVGPGQVLVRTRAVSLNYRDLLMVRGLYNPKQPLPLVPCSDGAGEVVACGDGVVGLSVGDRVATCFTQAWESGEPSAEKLRGTLGGPLPGTLAELLLLDARGVVPVPPHLTLTEAATLPCAALTAWSALVSYGRVEAGQTVLVQGTGGVSIFALQLARALGARVIATSSSDAKLERVRALGADETINYRQVPDWGKRARAATGGRGVDLVVDVGGAGTLAQSLAAVRVGGQIAVIGVLAGVVDQINILPILMQNVRLQGVLVGSRERFLSMNRAIAHLGLRPVVDRTFPFAESRAAFDHLASAQHLGKICIEL